MADSKTSLMTLCFGVFVFIGLGFSSVKKHIGTYIIAAALLFSVLELSFNIKDNIVSGLGRDPTFTGRTGIWEKVTSQSDINPLLGAGYESFWLGERTEVINEDYAAAKLTMAHSGYVETLINVGWIGLFFLGAMILSCYSKIRELLKTAEMTEKVLFARFAMAYLLAYLLYNYTEAGFKTTHFLFVMFLFFALTFQQRAPQLSASRFPQRFRDVPGVARGRDMPISVANARIPPN
jgi:O-antigen ligase